MNELFGIFDYLLIVLIITGVLLAFVLWLNYKLEKEKQKKEHS